MRLLRQLSVVAALAGFTQLASAPALAGPTVVAAPGQVIATVPQGAATQKLSVAPNAAKLSVGDKLKLAGVKLESDLDTPFRLDARHPYDAARGAGIVAHNTTANPFSNFYWLRPILAAGSNEQIRKLNIGWQGATGRRYILDCEIANGTTSGFKVSLVNDHVEPSLAAKIPSVSVVQTNPTRLSLVVGPVEKGGHVNIAVEVLPLNDKPIFTAIEFRGCEITPVKR